MNNLPLIQSLWVGPSLSKMEQLCIKSFLAHGHTFHLYTYEDVSNVPDGCIIKNGVEILGRDKIFTYQNGAEKGSVSGFSNFFRYKLLHDKGGYWVDMDMVCFKRFDFPGPYIVSSQLDESGNQELNCGVVLAPPGNTMCKEAFDICMSKDTSTVAFGQTGPVLIRAIVKKLGLDQYGASYNAFCPIHYYELNKIVGENNNIDEFMVNLIKDSYGVHLWNELWRRKGIDKNGVFPVNSLYQHLLNKHGL
jgi:hypothetical protein